MKPSHFREVKRCYDCRHCHLSYHHCSCCSEHDEYACKLHGFVMDESETLSHVCDDFITEEQYENAQVIAHSIASCIEKLSGKPLESDIAEAVSKNFMELLHDGWVPSEG
jgi:hypothetical protein